MNRNQSVDTSPSCRGGDEELELIALALMSCPHLGTGPLERILVHFGGVRQAFEALRAGEEFSLTEGRHRISARTAASIRAHLEHFDFESAARKLSSMRARVLVRGSPGYPSALDGAPSAPPYLVVAGRAEVLDAPSVAVVGTRRATATGLEVARRLGAELAEAGLNVVSGMARGIDAAAHRGTLGSGSAPGVGAAVAVLGCGIDVVYPGDNSALYADLLEGGVLVSQYGLGVRPEKWRFPERNRTIAGLSLAVVVVESYETGGALSTVAAANEAGREVYAVPGSVLNPAASGSNQLIVDGAAPVRSADDVLSLLSQTAEIRTSFGRHGIVLGRNGGRADSGMQSSSARLDEEESDVLGVLADGEPRTVGEVGSLTGLSTSQVLDALTALAKWGLVVPFGRDRFVYHAPPPGTSPIPY